MPMIDREGVEIFYESSGSGPPILLSHGYSATSQMWSAQIAAWKDRHEVIVWDMRGHGRSDSPDDPAAYSEEATVGDMAAILDGCGHETAIVAGLSLGGYMSLAFHASHPGRVRALMLFDTGPGYKNEAARVEWNVQADKRAGLFESGGLDVLGTGAEVEISTHRSAQGLAHAARGMLAQRNDRVMQTLPKIDVPTLVLVGEDDTAFIAATDYMSNKIPRAKKVVIPGAGHAANLDQPEAFNETTKAFLSALV